MQRASKQRRRTRCWQLEQYGALRAACIRCPGALSAPHLCSRGRSGGRRRQHGADAAARRRGRVVKHAGDDCAAQRAAADALVGHAAVVLHCGRGSQPARLPGLHLALPGVFVSGAPVC